MGGYNKYLCEKEQYRTVDRYVMRDRKQAIKTECTILEFSEAACWKSSAPRPHPLPGSWRFQKQTLTGAAVSWESPDSQEHSHLYNSAFHSRATLLHRSAQPLARLPPGKMCLCTASRGVRRRQVSQHSAHRPREAWPCRGRHLPGTPAWVPLWRRPTCWVTSHAGLGRGIPPNLCRPPAHPRPLGRDVAHPAPS